MDGLTLYLIAGGVILGNGGIVWLGLKAGLNGLRRDVQEIKVNVKLINSRVYANSERIARIEESTN
jgi:hypothetical protein